MSCDATRTELIILWKKKTERKMKSRRLKIFVRCAFVCSVCGEQWEEKRRKKNISTTALFINQCDYGKSNWWISINRNKIQGKHGTKHTPHTERTHRLARTLHTYLSFLLFIAKQEKIPLNWFLTNILNDCVFITT